MLGSKAAERPTVQSWWGVILQKMPNRLFGRRGRNFRLSTGREQAAQARCLLLQ